MSGGAARCFVPQAENQAIAAMAETERWDDLIAASGLTAPELDRIRVSLARGAVHAALRHAASAGLDVDNVFPLLARPRTLGQSVDLATVLHSRVGRWVEASMAQKIEGHGNYRSRL
jgi:Arc/MetJ family transcription regulator